MNIIKNNALLLGPIAAMLVAIFCARSGLESAASWTAAITTLCALWWMLEPIPIPVTSLIPFALFPVLGVLNSEQLAQSYGHSLILLLLGGFILSTALESSGTHRRIALGMVRIIGGRGKRLVLGFMVATAAISMWISNTATVLMLLPVVIAIIDNSEDSQLKQELTAPLLLGIAYGASIGGLGTPIGTPPNIIFLAAYKTATGMEISFAAWMAIALPAVIVLLPIAWWILARGIKSKTSVQLPQLGPWTIEERRVLAIFALTAALWCTRSAPFGGWSALFALPGASDTSVALTAAIAMFILPNGNGGRLLNWRAAVKIPWGLLLLFAGGLAIASAFQVSGLSEIVGNSLRTVTSFPLFWVLLIICLSVTFLTEITSNTAMCTLLMPILAATAVSANLEPRILMIPAALSASCAFMLPVATAPNAVVFGSNRLEIADMVKHGFFLNLFGALALSILCYFSL